MFTPATKPHKFSLSIQEVPCTRFHLRYGDNTTGSIQLRLDEEVGRIYASYRQPGHGLIQTASLSFEKFLPEFHRFVDELVAVEQKRSQPQEGTPSHLTVWRVQELHCDGTTVGKTKKEWFFSTEENANTYYDAVIEHRNQLENVTAAANAVQAHLFVQATVDGVTGYHNKHYASMLTIDTVLIPRKVLSVSQER